MTPANLNKLTQLERLGHYMSDTTGTMELSPEDWEWYMKLDWCDDQIRWDKADDKTVIARLRHKHPDISLSTARRVLEDCKRLHAISANMNKPYWRSLMIDWQVKAIKMAETKGDIRELNKALKNLMEMVALNDKEGEQTGNDIQQMTIIFSNAKELKLKEFDDTELERLAADMINRKAIERKASEEEYTDFSDEAE